MIALLVMLKHIHSLSYEYKQPGIFLATDELFRIDIFGQMGKFDYNSTSYHLDQMNFHQYGQIIDMEQQYYYNRKTTFIWVLSKMNDTTYIHQFQWENHKNTQILFQRTNHQLECYQIQISNQQLILDCRENNIDCFYFVELNSQSYYKYNQQQLNYFGKRKCMVMRNKIFIIKGNILQAYSYDLRNQPQFLYQKLLDIDSIQIEWTDSLQDYLYHIDVIQLPYIKNQYHRYIYSVLYRKAITWNEQKTLQICELQLINCTDLITINNIIDLDINYKYLYVKAQDFIFIHHYDINKSTRIINYTDKVLYNKYLNQLTFIDNSSISKYQIDNDLLNFIKVQNGSLLINLNNLDKIQQFYQNDKSMLITKTRDFINIQQEQIAQEYQYWFPFIGGSMKYDQDSKYMDVNIKFLKFNDELYCSQVYIIHIKHQYYFYCLINDNQFSMISQLHILKKNDNGGFEKLFNQQIHGQVIQIYSYLKTVCMNIYTNQTQIICSELNKNNELVNEFQQKGISFAINSFLSFNASDLQLIKNNLTQNFQFDKPQKVKYEQELIIVFTNFHVNTIIQLSKIKVMEKCSDFIDFICLKYYCIQICLTKIEKYAILSDSIIFCGNINLYGTLLNKKMKVTSSSNDHFYIWDSSQMLIFSSHTSLNQGFITTLNYSNIQNVVAQIQLICIQFIESWKCYQNSIRMEIIFNENLYHDTTSNLCASNYYDKQCITLRIQYYKRNKNIQLKQQQLKIKINKEKNQVNLGHDFYNGNVDGIISNKLYLINRYQIIQTFYNYLVLQSLFIKNFFVILTIDSILCYNLHSYQTQVHQINSQCSYMVPVENYIYVLCMYDDNIIFECLQNDCQFHSFQQSQIQTAFNIKIFDNYSLATSQNRIILFEWSNNTIKENIFQIPQYCFYDFTSINKELIFLIFDMGNVIKFIRNNITEQYSIQEVFQGIDDNIQLLNIMKIQFIDQNGNAYIRTFQNLYFFQFSMNEKPFYYGKIQYTNENIFIRDFKDQYILMFSNFNHILIYKFKLQDLQREIYYQLFKSLIPYKHQDNHIYIQDNLIMLKITHPNHIQLKEIKFDYIFSFELPIQPQQLTLILHNDKQQSKLSLIIEDETQDNIYFLIIIFTLVTIFVLLIKKTVQNQDI